MGSRLDMLQMFNPLLETKYNPQTIGILLEHYYQIENNINFRHLKYDLDNALVSERLTGDMRRLLFVKYNLELNIQQALRVLNIDFRTYIETQEHALVILSQECEQFELNCGEHVGGYMIDIFEQLEYKTANVMRIKPKDTEGLLYELGDNLMLSAFGVIEDNREYTDDISSKNKDIYITNDSGRKTSDNDEFYRKDYNNQVFLGDESLLIAELDGLGRDYY